jgi:hypothetical protein
MNRLLRKSREPNVRGGVGRGAAQCSEELQGIPCNFNYIKERWTIIRWMRVSRSGSGRNMRELRCVNWVSCLGAGHYTETGVPNPNHRSNICMIGQSSLFDLIPRCSIYVSFVRLCPGVLSCGCHGWDCPLRSPWGSLGNLWEWTVNLVTEDALRKSTWFVLGTNLISEFHLTNLHWCQCKSR